MQSDSQLPSAPPGSAPPGGSAASCELEVVPKWVTTLAETYEQGKVVIGGRRAGRTWAMRIATARPHQKQLPPNELSSPTAADGNGGAERNDGKI